MASDVSTVFNFYKGCVEWSSSLSLLCCISCCTFLWIEFSMKAAMLSSLDYLHHCFKCRNWPVNVPCGIFYKETNSMVLQGYWRSHWCLLNTSTQKYFWSSWFCFFWGGGVWGFLFVFSSLLTWKGFPSFNYFQISFVYL